MTSFNLKTVSEALQGAAFDIEEDNGITFEGKNMKLDTADDAEPIVDAILSCEKMQYLNLAGNTLGVEAAAALAKALEKKSEFKRALWKDMFTGRLKEEIPKALEYLGKGLVTAEARLYELDLSDNAFGPIGVAGLANLLKSRACFDLNILKLNNNGLGVGGGKMLANALLDCYEKSKKQNTPLTLKVFIAGRNRLENEGAKALAKVFEKIGTLEQISMPQNGIYHVGISALSDSFSKNQNLQIINLNDNTMGPKGSKALSKALVNLQKLRLLNLGDCLIKTRGAELLAKALTVGHLQLEEINLEANEIHPSGGLAVAKALINKPNLNRLILDGNQFGTSARNDIQKILNDAGHGDVLPEFEEDESEGSDEEDDDDDDEDDDEDDEDEEEDSEDEEEEEAKSSVVNLTAQSPIKTPEKNKKVVTIEQFLNSPDPDNFMALGEERTNLLIREARHGTTRDTYVEKFIPILMKVCALTVNSKEDVCEAAIESTNILYRELFSWGQQTEQLPILNNALLVHLGLIKSENKKEIPKWNIDGCFTALDYAVNQHYFPTQTKDTLKAFMEKCSVDPKLKSQIIISLNK